MTDRDALRDRLLATFRVEAREHAAALSSSLLDLEHAETPARGSELVEVAFRAAHSLKGAARAVGLSSVEAVCQALESALAALKRGALSASADSVDVLLGAVRVLEQLLDAADAGADASARPFLPTIRALKALVERPAPPPATELVPRLTAEEPPDSVPHSAPRAPAIDTVRVASSKLDEVRRCAEELLGEHLAATEHERELLTLEQSVVVARKQWLRLREEFGHVESAGDELELTRAAILRCRAALDANQAAFTELEQRAAAAGRSARQNRRVLGTKLDALLDGSKHLLMLPCSWLFEGLRHAFRELTRDLRKNAELVLEGETIELDRRILSELVDPFVHVLRNAVDHGIETPEERRASGKPELARVAIRAVQLPGNRVEVSISDDGRGIDVQALLAAATRLGRVDAARAGQLDREQILKLVFESDVSTSARVTELSGRGLGLAIVRDKVERLGGSIVLESEFARGTCIRLLLPLSLATSRGIVVRAKDQFMVLPTANVERVFRVRRQDIRTVENRETVVVFGTPIALVELADVLGLPKDRAPSDAWVSVFVMQAGARRLAFAVDEICREQDVLVKGLGRELAGLPGVVGATVLGSGKVAVVLDAPELVRAAIERARSGAGAALESNASSADERRSILVAEDSITSRMLLKTILEGAGFLVETAVDGVDAFAKLLVGDFDLVVSDVDMPRSSGLDLTSKIRAEKKLAELPVVLVTSLESPDDKQRGLEVGANAYIVKRSFEQSDLLEVVRRLI